MVSKFGVSFSRGPPFSGAKMLNFRCVFPLIDPPVHWVHQGLQFGDITKNHHINRLGRLRPVRSPSHFPRPRFCMEKTKVFRVDIYMAPMALADPWSNGILVGSSWWLKLNQPIWKNMQKSNWESFHQISGWKWNIFELPPPSIT